VKLYFFFALLLTALGAAAQLDDLMIVEFQDFDPGDGFQIKIYNPTNKTVNLNAYYVQVFNNGNLTPSSSSQLSGTLAAGASLIVGNPHACNSAISLAVNGVNNDDCIALTLGNTTNFVDMVNHYGTNTRPMVDHQSNAMFHHKWTRNSTNCIRYTSTDGVSVNSWKSSNAVNNPGWTVSGVGCLSASTGFVPQMPLGKVQLSVCAGDSVFLQGSWRTSDGTYTDTVAGVTFCDSLVETALAFLPSPVKRLRFDVCDPLATVQYRGEVFSGIGTHFTSIPALVGCDTLVEIEVQEAGVFADFMWSYQAGDSSKINVMDLSINGASIAWDFGDGQTLSGSSTAQHTYAAGGVYTVTLRVENEFGCIDSVQLTVYIPIEPTTPDVKVFVPNVFSPNGDGINDFFQVQASGVTTFNFQVYSRWGELLYSTSDPGFQWDGTFKGGSCAEGVYMYTLDTGERQQGFLTLVR
jgi:gliding motility-associated-like protein